MDLEPYTCSGFPGLLDGDAGEGEDLSDQKHPEPGILSISPLEDEVLLMWRDTDPVVLPGEDQPVLSLPGCYLDGGDMLAVPD